MVKNISLVKKTPLFPYRNRSLLMEIVLFGINNLPNKFTECKNDINIVLLNDKQMTYYNEKFLQHQGSTDVIAFSNVDDETELVGEILVSLQMADSYSQNYDVSLGEEVILYIIHGLLHLNGYDDHQDDDIKQMCFQETRLMKLIKSRYDLLALF